MKFIKPIILLLLFSSVIHALGGKKELRFRQINYKQGISHAEIKGIVQDEYGYIWIATYDGLNRFNGYENEVYRHNPFDSSSLNSSVIMCLFESNNKNLFIGTNIGVNIYDREHNSFKQIAAVDDEDNLYSNQIINVHEHLKEEYWLVGYDNVIFTLNSDYTLKRDPIMVPHENTNLIQTSVIDKMGIIYLGTSNEGILTYNTQTGNFKKLTFNHPDYNPNAFIYCLQIDDDNNLWIGDENGKIFRLSLNGITHKNDITQVLKIENCRIMSLETDKNNRIWIGTDNKGLFCYNRETKTTVQYEHTENSPESIAENSVTSILCDNQNNLWLGTHHKAISYTNLLSKKFYNITGNAETPNTLNQNTVSSVWVDNEDNLWIGTDGGGLNYYNKTSKKIHYFTHDNYDANSISDNAILTVFQDSDGYIWTGNYSAGISKINPKTKQITNISLYDLINGIPEINHVVDIIEDKSGMLWMSTNGGGLIHYDKLNNKIVKQYLQCEDGNCITNNYLTNLYTDNDDNIWIGSYYGLTKLTPEQELFQQFYHKIPDTNSLSSNWIFDISQVNQQEIIIATGQGLNFINKETNAIRSFRNDKTIPSNTINAIANDPAGCLWLSTNKGILKYNPNNGDKRNYDVNDGIQGNLFFANSSFQTKDDTIYFGGINGLTYFHPNDITIDSSLLSVTLTDFQLFNKSVKPKNEGILTKDISLTQKLTLKFSQSVFSIEYVAINYDQPDKIKYAYQLENFDEEWNYVESRRIATYTNLDPGHYVFKVKACNTDGVWSDEVTALEITITPPFYKTWGFKLLAGVLATLLLFLIYKIRVRRIHYLNRVLETQVKERTVELNQKNKLLLTQADELNETNTILEERQQHIEEQAEELKTQKEALEGSNIKLNELNVMKDKFLSIIGHDLKNPISIIMGFTELLLVERNTITNPKHIMYLQNIFDSSRKTYDLLENLLNWARSQSGSLQHKPEMINISASLSKILSLVKEQALKKGVTIELKQSDQNIKVFADVAMIETVLRNLISNALKFTPKDGNITISYASHTSDFILLSIKDTGVGMEKDAVDKLFRIDRNESTAGTDGETGTGLGLILCKEFIDKNGGEIWVESEPDKGTTFYFTLPLKK